MPWTSRNIIQTASPRHLQGICDLTHFRRFTYKTFCLSSSIALHLIAAGNLSILRPKQIQTLMLTPPARTHSLLSMANAPELYAALLPRKLFEDLPAGFPPSLACQKSTKCSPPLQGSRQSQ